MDTIRALHAPVWNDTLHGLYCSGCDYGGWEGEDPNWPCRTAALVYTEAERADWVEAATLFDRWYYQMTNRNPGPPRPLSKVLGNAIWAQTYEGFIADKVFPKVPAMNTNPITFRFEKGFSS